MGMECSRLCLRLSTTLGYLFCICVEWIGMGCRFARRTIRLPHGDGCAGYPGSFRLLCFVSVSNGLEWVAIVQDELFACLMVTGEEVLETLGPLVFCLYMCMNRLEWVVTLQDELSACLMVTGEEVLETLGPCQTDWSGLPLCRMNYPPASW
jgi:hypothetical protein